MPLKLSFHRTLPFILLFSASAWLPAMPAAASEVDFEKNINVLEQTINTLEKGTAHVTGLFTRRADSQDAADTTGIDTEAVEVEMIVFGRTLRMELLPFNIFAPGAKVVRVTDNGSFEEPATANTYRGVVIGFPESVVAVSIREGIPEGLMLVDDDVYLIRRALRSETSVAPGELIALRGSAQKMGLTAIAPAEVFNLLDIAAVADFEYFQLHGSDASDQIASVINQVDAVYKSEIETGIQILTTMVFETSLDPFSNFNSGNLFIDFRDTTIEFGDWRAAQSGDLSTAGLGHLFSNKFGINAGFGFINVLCSASTGVSISTTNYVSLHPLIIEHEFGHNFGAGHDGEAGGTCANAPPGFIMASAATGTTFSDCSKTIMRANRDLAVCISQPDHTIFADGFESGATGTE